MRWRNPAKADCDGRSGVLAGTHRREIRGVDALR